MVAVAVVNQKGGVGKTTVVLGLASAASAGGVATLVVDLDPQGNATTGLGVFESGPGIEQVLTEDNPGGLAAVERESAWSGDVGLPPRLVPSSPGLAVLESQLASDPLGAQGRLAMALGNGAGSDHPLVLIDCPPSLGLLTVNALFAADLVLVVTEPGAWAVDGVARMLQTVERIRLRRSDGSPGLVGIAVNRLGRTRDGRYWSEQLEEAYPGRCLPPIRLRAAVAEAAAHSLPIHALGRRPGAAEAAAEFEVLLDRIPWSGSRSRAGSVSPIPGSPA
ncbi:MAG: AAA family ATPase [Actinomycetota bacterium]|nr:AAA family ATPase [Actinomycetota bacterium]